MIREQIIDLFRQYIATDAKMAFLNDVEREQIIEQAISNFPAEAELEEMIATGEANGFSRERQIEMIKALLLTGK